MKIKDYLDLDVENISKMSRKEISKAVTTLGSAANKRLKRAEKAGRTSPAIYGLEKSGGKISSKNKNINQLRAEFVRARNFLTAKTSTYAGCRAVQKEFEKRIGGKLDADETNKFWSAYNKLNELEPNFIQQYGSDRMQQYLRQEIEQNPEKDSDSISLLGRKRLQSAYEQIESESLEKEGQINGTFGFFKFRGNK